MYPPKGFEPKFKNHGTPILSTKCARMEIRFGGWW
jgi:hypothetical protein